MLFYKIQGELETERGEEKQLRFVMVVYPVHGEYNHYVLQTPTNKYKTLKLQEFIKILITSLQTATIRTALSGVTLQ